MARANSSGQHSYRESERRERKQAKAMRKAARRAERGVEGQREERPADGELPEEEETA